jgi:hypothetical protein
MSRPVSTLCFWFAILPLTVLASCAPSAHLAAPEVAAVPSTVARPTAPAVAVGAQYDTAHVYIAPDDVDRFAQSFLATFGGHSTKQVEVTVTPTPSRTSSQLLQTPVGTVSLFGFKTGVPYPFGAERTGYLVTDLDVALRSAQASGAAVLVSAFPDPIGRDAVIQWPGGVNMQLYWHFTHPSYDKLQTVPENRVYISPDRADEFLRDFLEFSHGTVLSDEADAPGVEVGRPADTYRRVRVDSSFGRLTALVTDGHLPFPYGHESTGYEVASLADTLTKAQAAGVRILVQPYNAGDRQATLLEFPGGYVAEVHGPAGAPSVSAAFVSPTTPDASPLGHADVQRWVDAWNSHDIGTVAALFEPDAVIHQPSNSKPLDVAGARAFFSMIFKAYPDFHVDLQEAGTSSTFAETDLSKVMRLTQASSVHAPVAPASRWGSRGLILQTMFLAPK